MRIVRLIQHRPLSALTSLVVCFGAWVAVDARDLRPLSSAPAQPRTVNIDAGRPSHDEAGRTGAPGLEPGTPRGRVEEQFGAPPGEAVRPVVLAGGRVTYRVSYRPHDSVAAAGAGRVPPRPPVEVEYDAGQPGHPLVAVRGAEGLPVATWPGVRVNSVE